MEILGYSEDPYCNAEGEYDWEQGVLKEGGKFPTVIDANGVGYRLPSEREWEYGCRALSVQAYSFGQDPNLLSLFAWYAGKSSPTICGSQRPSRWGLSDMHGNVLEWCWDQYDPTEEASSASRVLRGGSFFNGIPDFLRSAIRDSSSPEGRDYGNGFRLSRTK